MPEMNGVLLSILHELGFHKIQLFNNTDEAWQMTVKVTPDLIICDWYPEAGDALVYLKSVRSTENTKDIPFIIVSGVVEHDMVNQVISLGVSEYIVKPFNIKMFEDKIEHSLKYDRLNYTKNRQSKDESNKFATKVALCVSDPNLLTLSLNNLKDKTTLLFNDLDAALEAIKSDKTIDVLIVDDVTIIKQPQVQTKLVKLAASGQLETILLKTQESSEQQVFALRKSGFEHIVFPLLAPEDIKIRTELLLTLKKALLHTKDTVQKLAIEREKDKEFQENLLQSIRVENTKVRDLGQQIVSTSKKSSFTSQLGQEIAQKSMTINSFVDAMSSVIKDVRELQQTEKESVSILELFNNTQGLFENLLEQRKLALLYDTDIPINVLANPTLFTSLFMFFVRAVIHDARYDSQMELMAKHQEVEQITEIKIRAFMAGFPHLSQITERIWYEQNGEMHYVLKGSIEQLSESQLSEYKIIFDQDSGVLEVSLFLTNGS